MSTVLHDVKSTLASLYKTLPYTSFLKLYEGYDGLSSRRWLKSEKSISGHSVQSFDAAYGNVNGNLPDGLTAPKRTSAIPFPTSLPP